MTQSELETCAMMDEQINVLRIEWNCCRIDIYKTMSNLLPTHRLATDPLPVLGVLGVARGAEPVLAVSVPAVPPPQLPAEEPLQRGVGLVHQRAAALRTERLGLPEVSRLEMLEIDVDYRI